MRRAAHAQLSPCDCPPNIRYVSGMVPYYGVPLGTKKTPSLLIMLFILYVCSMAQAKYMFFLILEILKYKLRHLPPFLVICMFTLRHLPPCLRPVTPLRVLRRRPKATSKLCITGLCEGNSPGTDEFPAQKASNAENVSIWWRHHVVIDGWGISFEIALRWMSVDLTGNQPLPELMLT